MAKCLIWYNSLQKWQGDQKKELILQNEYTRDEGGWINHLWNFMPRWFHKFYRRNCFFFYLIDVSDKEHLVVTMWAPTVKLSISWVFQAPLFVERDILRIKSELFISNQFSIRANICLTETLNHTSPLYQFISREHLIVLCAWSQFLLILTWYRRDIFQLEYVDLKLLRGVFPSL